MENRRSKIIAFHGLKRRYENIVDQCAMCKGSKGNLEEMFNNQRSFLEDCDAVLSIGTFEAKFGVAMITFANTISEYFVEKFDNVGDKRFVDDVHREIAVLEEGLQLWARESLRDKKLAVVTSKNQAYALLQANRSLDSSKNGNVKLELVDRIFKLAHECKVEMMVFSLHDTDHRLIDLLGAAVVDAGARDQLQKMIEQSDMRKVTKVEPVKQKILVEDFDEIDY
uniref:RNase H type-1 domain-containing protein n=1 Tax=Plectus sambesii TaxID=2011161 RepID=A0A914UJY5_9BILA